MGVGIARGDNTREDASGRNARGVIAADAGGWIEELWASAAATRIVTDELDKAAVRLGQVQRKTETGEANA
jgi:hypothetical protein